MLIKKENKNSVTCRMSKEELNARGFDSLEDLMHDQESARKLLNEIIEEAKETVNFTADSSQINVQIAGLADGSVTIKIFSDRNSAVRSLIEKYKNLAQAVEQEENKADEEKPAENDPDEGVEVDTIAPRFEGKQSISAMPEEKFKEMMATLPDDAPVMLPVAISFDTLEDAIALCRRICDTNQHAKSDLYKLDGRYYLLMQLTDTKNTLGNSVFAISEYSGKIERHGDIQALLKEHGEAIRRGDAVAMLGSL